MMKKFRNLDESEFNTLVNIVAFAILMDSGLGISDKSPEYVLEKFQRYATSPGIESWKHGLDTLNRAKLEDYFRKYED